MNKVAFSFTLPFAIKGEAVINPANGYRYTKRILQEYNDFMSACKNESIYVKQNRVKEEDVEDNSLLYISVWINVDLDFVKVESLNKILDAVKTSYASKTPTKHSFEK